MACIIAFGSHLAACTALAGYGSNCGQMVVDRHSSATPVPVFGATWRWTWQLRVRGLTKLGTFMYVYVCRVQCCVRECVREQCVYK